MATTTEETKIEEIVKENAEATSEAEQAPDGEKNEVEVEVEEDEDSEEAMKEEALKVYKALRNPQSAIPLIQYLAQNAGLKLADAPTQTQIKTEAKSILSIFQEELGEEYKFLAPRLGKAVEGALKEHAKQQETGFAELAQSQIESQVDRAYEKLARETKGDSKRLETRMAQLADEIPIGSQNVDTYIRRLYTIADGESSSKSATKQTADKIRRNASDASARIKGSAAGTEVTQIPEKKMSLQESVQFALNQQTKK